MQAPPHQATFLSPLITPTHSSSGDRGRQGRRGSRSSGRAAPFSRKRFCGPTLGGRSVLPRPKLQSRHTLLLPKPGQNPESGVRAATQADPPGSSLHAPSARGTAGWAPGSGLKGCQRSRAPVGSFRDRPAPAHARIPRSRETKGQGHGVHPWGWGRALTWGWCCAGRAGEVALSSGRRLETDREGGCSEANR